MNDFALCPITFCGKRLIPGLPQAGFRFVPLHVFLQKMLIFRENCKMEPKSGSKDGPRAPKGRPKGAQEAPGIIHGVALVNQEV